MDDVPLVVPMNTLCIRNKKTSEDHALTSALCIRSKKNDEDEAAESESEPMDIFRLAVREVLLMKSHRRH
jgi:hypothetical protein